jgi:hypothetical protein
MKFGYNISEFESGVVFFDREHAYRSVANVKTYGVELRILLFIDVW